MPQLVVASQLFYRLHYKIDGALVPAAGRLLVAISGKAKDG